MQINGIGNIDPLQHSNNQKRAGKAYGNQPAEAEGAAPVGDEIELSGEAKFISKLSRLPDVRQERVDELRKQITEGKYPTPEKLEAGVRKMLEQL